MSPPTRNELEKEFEMFFNFCKQRNFSQKELQQICGPLVSRWRWRLWRNIGAGVFAVSMIWWLCCNVEVFNWTLSALGRLILIQLLPFWNWTPLYKAKCLVEKTISDEVRSSSAVSLGKYETDRMNCVLCEHFDTLPILTNTSYSLIEQKYLEKGLPIVIHDSHPIQSLENIISIIREDSTSNFLGSQPCNIETNLLMKKFFSIEAVLNKITEKSTNDNQWFLQLRNCQFDAVKASRKFIRRPYYYPLHFEPFYSSWLLMSNNYKGPQKELYVQGLIFVQQLSGETSITLIPKSPCEKLCLEVEFVLLAGEGLVFSTDMWTLNYKTNGVDETVTTIMEIDWHL